MVSSVFRNLFSGFKLLLLFPRTRLDDFNRSLAGSFQLVVLGVIALAILSYAKQQHGEIYFNDGGATFLGTSLLAGIVLAILITRLQGSLDRLPDLLTPLAALIPWTVAALSVLSLFLDPANNGDFYWRLALIWCLAAFIGAVRLAFPGISLFVPLGTAILIAFFTLSATNRGHTFDLFYSYDSLEYEQYASLDQEGVFLSQARLLEQELQDILPGRPDETDFYFVGFAGNGDESVFASEARFVQEQVDREFSTEQRSLVLASDFDSVDTQPLANTHNLFQAISHIGDKMNTKDDVLFLFLTSHGARDAYIDVSLFPLQLKQLTAEDLRSALDAAMIEWRIIVVSACYSGSFIEPLATDKTVVITASASDKTSFGCSNTRDLTYFGEAFFRDAFGNGGSLLDRFEEAKVSIGEREFKEGRSLSEPQIYIGSEIEQKLEAHLLSGVSHD